MQLSHQDLIYAYFKGNTSSYLFKDQERKYICNSMEYLQETVPLLVQ